MADFAQCIPKYCGNSGDGWGKEAFDIPPVSSSGYVLVFYVVTADSNGIR
jgi:hypothetical protein